MSEYYRRRILAVVLLTLAALIPTSAGAANDHGVLPPQAKFKGLGYSEWQAKWWQAVLAIPLGPDHPFIVGGAFGDEQGLLFLTGLGSPGPGQTVTIAITIAAGTALFFPLINAECSSLEPPPFHGGTEAEQLDCARGFTDDPQAVFAEIDGRPLLNFERYYTEAPQFTIDVPADNVLGVSGPATGTSVDTGFYLLVAPLSVGTHTLHFGGQFSAASGGFLVDTTYLITVTPR